MTQYYTIGSGFNLPFIREVNPDIHKLFEKNGEHFYMDTFETEYGEPIDTPVRVYTSKNEIWSIILKNQEEHLQRAHNEYHELLTKAFNDMWQPISKEEQFIWLSKLINKEDEL